MIYPLKTNKKYESIKQNQSRDLKLIRLYNLLNRDIKKTLLL